jgi:hypothetical protein
VSPVKYDLGFYITEDDISHSHRRENIKSYTVLFVILDVRISGLCEVHCCVDICICSSRLVKVHLTVYVASE